MIRSLRARLMLGSGIAATAIFLAAALAIYAMVRSALIDEFDAVLFTKARSIASMTEYAGTTLKLETEPGELSEFETRKNPEYFQLVNSEGRTILRSTMLATGDLF